jgi:hypothetical protein
MPLGKIGRLSAEDRTRVNEMLRDHRPADEIIRFCAGLGVEVSDANVSNWKANGFRKWMRRQERLEEIRERREYAARLVEEGGARAQSDAASAEAVDLISEVLEEFDRDALVERMRERPEQVVPLLNALSTIRRRDQQAVETELKLDQAKALAREAEEQAEETGNGDLKALAKKMSALLGA